jgi:hypothetical protein
VITFQLDFLSRPWYGTPIIWDQFLIIVLLARVYGTSQVLPIRPGSCDRITIFPIKLENLKKWPILKIEKSYEKFIFNETTDGVPGTPRD